MSIDNISNIVTLYADQAYNSPSLSLLSFAFLRVLVVGKRGVSSSTVTFSVAFFFSIFLFFFCFPIFLFVSTRDSDAYSSTEEDNRKVHSLLFLELKHQKKMRNLLVRTLQNSKRYECDFQVVITNIFVKFRLNTDTSATIGYEDSSQPLITIHFHNTKQTRCCLFIL